jgi:hypothetical protein
MSQIIPEYSQIVPKITEWLKTTSTTTYEAFKPIILGIWYNTISTTTYKAFHIFYNTLKNTISSTY